MSGSRKFFSAEEKMCLKELVEKHRNVLENKKTDCISVSKKKTTWEILAKEFNSMALNTNRSAEQLKKCWENMKSRRKDELSSLKRYRMGTGGGSHQRDNNEATIDDVLSVVDTELGDTLDSDTVALSHNFEGDYIVNADNVLESTSEEQTTESNEVNEVNNVEVDVEVNTPERSGRSNVAGHDSHRTSSATRGTALDRELGQRMQRTMELIQQDREIHLLRMEQEKELHSLQKQIHSTVLQREQEKIRNENELRALIIKGEMEKIKQERELHLLRIKKLQNNENE